MKLSAAKAAWVLAALVLALQCTSFGPPYVAPVDVALRNAQSTLSSASPLVWGESFTFSFEVINLWGVDCPHACSVDVVLSTDEVFDDAHLILRTIDIEPGAEVFVVPFNKGDAI